MAVIPGQKANSPKQQADSLRLSVNEFTGCINSLPNNLFLKKMDDWAPRDVTAHLIGWNLYTIEGGRQLLKGDTPFYFFDPGDNFSKINAVLVQRYNSKNRAELVRQMENSAEELKHFILSLVPADWNTDYGVLWNGGAVTVKNTVDALIKDYDSHRQQIENWVRNLKP